MVYLYRTVDTILFMKMKKGMLVGSLLFLSLCSIAQKETINQENVIQATSVPSPKESSDLNFEQFCNLNACTVFTSEKSISTDGTLQNVSGKKIVLSEIGIKLLEDKAQVFQLASQPNTYVKVESLYRLRLMFNSIQANK